MTALDHPDDGRCPADCPCHAMNPDQVPPYDLTDAAATLPPEPLTYLQQIAAHHHELYSAWCAAGFREGQALELLIAHLNTPPHH